MSTPVLRSLKCKNFLLSFHSVTISFFFPILGHGIFALRLGAKKQFELAKTNLDVSFVKLLFVKLLQEVRMDSKTKRQKILC